jgi:acetamidase/formamidase
MKIIRKVATVLPLLCALPLAFAQTGGGQHATYQLKPTPRTVTWGYKDMHLLWPSAETPDYYITMGINADLTQATQMAVHHMIDFLMQEKHLSRDDAYMLASVAADLHISEIVDGNDVVSMMMPKAIFEHTR